MFHSARSGFGAFRVALFGSIAASAAVGARAQAPAAFAELHPHFPEWKGPTNSLAPGDVDGDGDNDLVLGNYGEPSRLYVNTGGGVYADVTSAQLPVSYDSTRAVALGDLDGDGDLDLVLGNEGDPSTGFFRDRLYRNDGTGHFSDVTATHLPIVLDPTTSLAIGDVDGDGDPDLIVGNGNTLSFSAYPNLLYTNDGTGVLSISSGLPADVGPTQALALLDMDGDLDLDLYTVNGWLGPTGSSPASNRLFQNDGFGSFADVTAAHLPPTSGGNGRSIAVGDVDLDGDADVSHGTASVGGSAPGAVHLELNDSSGHFADATSTHVPALAFGEGAWAIALGEVDGDGDGDLVLGIQYFSTTWKDRLFANDGAGHFADATAASLPTVDDQTRAVALTDVNGDGDLDLFFANSGVKPSLLLRNDGAGHFTMPDDLHAFPASATGVFFDVAARDLDGDGDRDVVAPGDPASVLCLGDGTGAFEDVTATHLPATGPLYAEIAIEDVDGDGDADLAIGDKIGKVLRLFTNDGTAHFTNVTATHIPADPTPTAALAFADVDGDGDADLVTGEGGFLGPAQNRLYVNVATGHFADVTPFHLPASLEKTEAVAFADVDGDADLDLVLGLTTVSNGGDRLLLNDGAGHFANAPAGWMPIVYQESQAVAVGDVDADGYTDIVAAKAVDGVPLAQSRLYRNDGTGHFADVSASALPVHPDDAWDVALGDVDGDGDPDVTLCSYANANALWRNDGTGTFGDATPLGFPDPLDVGLGLVLEDMDEDGDRDVVLSGDGRLRLLTNLRTQLARHHPPAIGAPLRMDLYGPPSAPWFLAFAAAAVKIPLPPFGTLQLDPTSLFVAKTGALDAQGLGAAAFSVPGDPALLGFALQWQAFVGALAVLTNREVTSFTSN